MDPKKRVLLGHGIVDALIDSSDILAQDIFRQ